MVEHPNQSQPNPGPRVDETPCKIGKHSLQSLTLSPTVRDGVIVYEDSPLVKAVKAGHVLVVDEADKAPTHVTWYVTKQRCRSYLEGSRIV